MNGYNIGEVAELLGVSRDTLRIYEEQGLIKPMRNHNGYRIYTDDDMGLRYLCSEFDVSRIADENKNNDKDKNKNGERLISEKPKAGFLIIKDYEPAAVKRSDLMEKTVRMSFESCIVRRIISKEPVPGMEEILKTLSLAEVYGMKAGGSIFSYFIHRYENKGSKAAEYLIELCMPVCPLK